MSRKQTVFRVHSGEEKFILYISCFCFVFSYMRNTCAIRRIMLFNDWIICFNPTCVFQLSTGPVKCLYHTEKKNTFLQKWAVAVELPLVVIVFSLSAFNFNMCNKNQFFFIKNVNWIPEKGVRWWCFGKQDVTFGGISSEFWFCIFSRRVIHADQFKIPIFLGLSFLDTHAFSAHTQLKSLWQSSLHLCSQQKPSQRTHGR